MTVYNAKLVDKDGNLPSFGDYLEIERFVNLPTLGQAVTTGWLTVKENEADPDLDAVLQKVITDTNDPAQGEIIDDGSATGQATLLFRVVPPTDFAKLTAGVHYVYDVQVSYDVDAKTNTLEKGTAEWVASVTKATS